MQGIVACPQPWSADVGIEVMESGGNAFDAALAASFTQWVWDPFMCGPGGMGVSQVYSAKKNENKVISFAGRAGSKARPDMWESDLKSRTEVSSLFVFDDFRNELGYTSIMLPTVISGFAEIHKRYCTMPWDELLSPAIEQAKIGLPIHPTFMDWITMPVVPGQPSAQKRFSATDECKKIFLQADGSFHPYGSTIDMRDMAETLGRIAKGGPGEFYEGDLSKEILEDFEKHGAFVTESDFSQYKPRVYDPLIGHYHGKKITAVKPPDSGQTIIQALRLLESFDLQQMDHGSSEYLHVLGSALSMAHQDRLDYNADPEFCTVPVDEVILDQDRLSSQISQIRKGYTGKSTGDVGEGHTTTISVADEEGNFISLTHTLGWASGVVTPGLGFIYNNGMNLADPRTGQPNSIAPGKARMSNMVPTLIWNEERPEAAIGALGGAVIISAIVQSIVHMIDFGMSPAEAVLAPRIHTEGGPLFLEARFRAKVVDELIQMGHAVRRDPFPLNPLMARAQVVLRGSDGLFLGGSDPRSGGGGVAISRI